MTNQVANTSTVNSVAVMTYDGLPTISSGFGGSGAQVLGNQVGIFRVIFGGTAGNTGTFVFPFSAPNGWLVQHSKQVLSIGKIKEIIWLNLVY